jgi:hypothetical protein
MAPFWGTRGMWNSRVKKCGENFDGVWRSRLGKECDQKTLEKSNESSLKLRPMGCLGGGKEGKREGQEGQFIAGHSTPGHVLSYPPTVRPHRRTGQHRPAFLLAPIPGTIHSQSPGDRAIESRLFRAGPAHSKRGRIETCGEERGVNSTLSSLDTLLSPHLSLHVP